MPVQPSYPGVYIEEVPSGVRTITGVPTSIAAFVGTAPRGPDGEATAIGSPLEYERVFGLANASPLAVAIGLFFRNGGTQALVVRVAGRSEARSRLTLQLKDGGKAAGIVLEAKSKGAWGGQLSASVDYELPANGIDRYTLTIRDKSSNRSERSVAVSSDPKSERSLRRMLEASALVRLVGDGAGLPNKTAPDAKAGQAPDPGAGFVAFTLPPAADDKPPAAKDDKPPAGAKDDAAGVPAAEKPPATDKSPAGDKAPPAKPEPEWEYAPATLSGGLYALNEHDVFFNMLVLAPPPGEELAISLLGTAAKVALDKRAFLIVDAPTGWIDTDAAIAGRDTGLFDSFDEASKRNAAVYFPRLMLDDLGSGAGPGIDVTAFPASGAVAGLYARTDTERGIWKAPAGIATGIGGTLGLTDVLTDFDSGRLNPVAINALRTLPLVGNVVWGARTMVGSDLEASAWKYVPVRRLALYIEESLYRGTQWVVFEPNDEPLWAQIRLNVGAFMHTLFRQGAFQGTAARDAYFVKCDKDANPQADIDRGVVNIIVGFAPLKPAEFVIIQLQQIAGPLEV